MSDSNRSKRSEDVGQGFSVLIAIALCCTIVSILTYAWVYNSTTDSERASYYQEEAERNKNAICIGSEGSDLAKCLVEQQRASDEAYNAEQDLNAQRNMAIWAFAMFAIASITAALTLWALWYIKRTLEETARAAKAAQISGDAYIWNERARLKQIEPVAGRPTPLPRDIFPKVRIQNIGKSVGEIVSVNAQRIGDNQRKIGNSIEWGSAGRIVEPDKDVTLRGLPVTMNAGDIIMFQVGVKYRVLGGAEDTLDCTCRVIVDGMPDSVGKHGVTLSK